MECRHKILLKSGITVPCGKCAVCLANLRQEWVFRLKQEYLDSEFAIFVTLTYDDDHLPLDFSVNKKDVQLFHKRLRKHFPSKDLRYYLVSEYGDRTHRPHYHGLYFFKTKYELSSLYDVFEKAWSNGFIKFGNVEEGSIVYCTKYCLKHCVVPPGCKPTFRLVSKQDGGLGSRYLTLMSDYHITNEQFGFVSSEGSICRMPKYFRDKLKPKLNPALPEYYERQFRSCDEVYSKNIRDFNQDFRDFCSNHSFPDLVSAERAFNEYLQNCAQNQEELIVKHCKKQIL